MAEAGPAFSPRAWRWEPSSSSSIQVRTKRLHPRAGVLGQQLGQWFPKCGSGPASLASSGNLLTVPIFRPHPDLQNPKHWVRGQRVCVRTSPPGGFWFSGISMASRSWSVDGNQRYLGIRDFKKGWLMSMTDFSVFQKTEGKGRVCPEKGCLVQWNCHFS